MRNRPAFTLLELIVSIAVAGIIALLAYGSASAGFDTRDALARYQATSEAELRARTLLADALRHATDDADSARAAFEIEDAVDQRGLASDRLTFLTRGIVPPLGASARWIVTLSAGARGLDIIAIPTEAAAGSPIIARLANVRGLDVQAMSLAERRWNSSWVSTAQVPAAVRLTFYDATGTQVGSPLVVRVGLEAVR